jgi:hypothetical protein
VRRHQIGLGIALSQVRDCSRVLGDRTFGGLEDRNETTRADCQEFRTLRIPAKDSDRDAPSSGATFFERNVRSD